MEKHTKDVLYGEHFKTKVERPEPWPEPPKVDLCHSCRYNYIYDIKPKTYRRCICDTGSPGIYLEEKLQNGKYGTTVCSNHKPIIPDKESLCMTCHFFNREQRICNSNPEEPTACTINVETCPKYEYYGVSAEDIDNVLFSEKQIGGDHYSKHKIQPWDIIDEYGLGFYEGNILKYLLRRKGNRIEDLQKLIHYAEKAIKNLQEVKFK